MYRNMKEKDVFMYFKFPILHVHTFSPCILKKKLVSVNLSWNDKSLINSHDNTKTEEGIYEKTEIKTY